MEVEDTAGGLAESGASAYEDQNPSLGESGRDGKRGQRRARDAAERSCAIFRELYGWFGLLPTGRRRKTHSCAHAVRARHTVTLKG